MPLFLGEICSQGNPPVLFSTLRQRLIRRLNDEIRAGKLTERGLARRAGLSQPHVHNLLKGIRSLTAESADAMLRAISAGVGDLIEQRRADSPAILVSLLRGAVGPGGRWDDQADGAAEVECSLLAGISQPAIVRILPDDEMGGISGYALVDLRPAPFPRSGLHVIIRDGQARLRYVRFGRDRVYFPASANLNRPCQWESVPRNLDRTVNVLLRVFYLEDGSGPAASL